MNDIFASKLSKLDALLIICTIQLVYTALLQICRKRNDLRKIKRILELIILLYRGKMKTAYSVFTVKV